MIVCRIGFPGKRKKNALNYKRRKIFFVHPKLNRMKEEWHANSFENIWLSSKNLADFNFHYFTAIKQQTKQVSFPSISGPSPLYLGAGAFLCLSHNRLFTPLAKKARDKLRGFKEWGFCLLLLCYITQGMLIFIRAFMSQLVMAHVTALPTPVSPQSDLSNIFFSYGALTLAQLIHHLQQEFRCNPGKTREGKKRESVFVPLPAQLQTANQSIYSIKGHSTW